MGIKRFEKIMNEEITTMAGETNVSENITEGRLIWFGQVERKTEEDVVMITWNMDVDGHRKIGRLKLK